jgi:hypothetical protein
MNVVSVCYFVFRIVFVQLYVRTTTQKGSIWRSVVWVLCTSELFGLGGLWVRVWVLVLVLDSG